MDKTYWFIAANSSNYQQAYAEHQRKVAEMQREFEETQAQNERFATFAMVIGVIIAIFKLLSFFVQISAATKVQKNVSYVKVPRKSFGMSEKGDKSIAKYDSLQGMSADEMLSLGFLTYGVLTAAQLQQQMDDMQMQMDQQMQMDMQINQQFMEQMQRDMDQMQMQMNQQFVDNQMAFNDPNNFSVLSGNETMFQNDLNSFGGGFDSFGGMGF